MFITRMYTSVAAGVFFSHSSHSVFFFFFFFNRLWTATAALRSSDKILKWAEVTSATRDIRDIETEFGRGGGEGGMCRYEREQKKL